MAEESYWKRERQPLCATVWTVQYLRDFGVFQSCPTQSQYAHGCSTADEDEERDQLVGKGQNNTNKA